MKVFLMCFFLSLKNIKKILISILKKNCLNDYDLCECVVECKKSERRGIFSQLRIFERMRKKNKNKKHEIYGSHTI